MGNDHAGSRRSSASDDYMAVPAAANALGIDLVQARSLPYRDNQTYFLNPNKHGEDGARRFATEAFQVARPSAVIFADYTPYSVLRYVQLVEGVRPDVLSATPTPSGRRCRSSGCSVREHRRPTVPRDLDA